MRYGDNDGGQPGAVATVQRQLVQLGYRLDRYGCDGSLGDETWAALEAFAKAQMGRRAWNPEVPAAVLEALGAAQKPPAPDPSAPLPGPVPGASVVDLRHEQTDPAPKTKVVNGKTVRRAPHTVTALVLHQTACTFGVSNQQIQAAGGDRSLALHRRALNVACHALAFRDGTAVIANDPASYVFHANTINAQSIGLEIEGRFPGDDSQPDATTWGGDPTPLTEELIAAGREGARRLVELSREAGIEITEVYAHRQSSSSRRSDPGQSIWQRIGLEYCVAVLGLKPRQSFATNGGRPIPTEWDPDGVGRY